MNRVVTGALHTALGLACCMAGCGEDSVAEMPTGMSPGADLGDSMDPSTAGPEDPAQGEGPGTADPNEPGSPDTPPPDTEDPGTDEPPDMADAGEPAVPSACDSWLVRYEFTGGAYRVDAMNDLGDATYPLEQPHADRDKVGPGFITLRFSGDDVGPTDGSVQVVSYELVQGFTAVVADTDLVTSAGLANDLNTAGECGVADGELVGTALAWTAIAGSAPPAHLREVRTVGAVTCDGALCSFVPDGTLGDRDTTTTQGLGDFQFSDDLSGFTAAEFLVGSDPAGDTYLSFEGSEQSRECVQRPAC